MYVRVAHTDYTKLILNCSVIVEVFTSASASTICTVHKTMCSSPYNVLPRKDYKLYIHVGIQSQ